MVISIFIKAQARLRKKKHVMCRAICVSPKETKINEFCYITCVTGPACEGCQPRAADGLEPGLPLAVWLREQDAHGATV